MTAAILFGFFLVLLLLRTPIGISLGFSSLITIWATGMVKPTYLAQSLVTSCDSFPMMAIPFFVLAGELMGQGGISRRLLDCADVFFGRKAGGLAMVTVVACMFFAAISGSGPATVAAIGGITIPTMIQQGYDRKFACGLCAAAGAIGCIIPPSIPMVTYSVAATTSVAALFMAGIVPGLLIGASLMLYASFVSKKKGYINPDAQPFSWSRMVQVFWNAKWSLLVPVIILGGIYGGIFTPTEAAAVAVAYGFIVGCFVYREIKLKDLWNIFCSAALTTGTIMIVMGSATAYGRILALERIPQMVASFFLSISDNLIVILMLINVLLLFVGCFMDPNSSIIILAPIFLPIVQAMGMNVIHFGIVMVVNLSMGLCTPPLGGNLFVAVNVGQLSLEDVSKGVIKFLLVMILDLLLITYLEPVSMILPRLLGYNY